MLAQFRLTPPDRQVSSGVADLRLRLSADAGSLQPDYAGDTTQQQYESFSQGAPPDAFAPPVAEQGGPPGLETLQETQYEYTGQAYGQDEYLAPRYKQEIPSAGPPVCFLCCVLVSDCAGAWACTT